MSVLTTVTERLKQALEEAVAQTGLVSADSLPEVMLDVPREKAHGDFSTNIAMQLTRLAKKNPREIAEQIVHSLDLNQAGVDRVEIAGPGFINFFTSKAYLREVIAEALKAGQQFGSSQLGNNERIQIEFVSANPTGSLHLGHARGAAIGDALCNLLEFAGYDVSREYYINDAGNQIDNLARSIEARYLEALGHEASMPEDGYYGEDIKQFAAELADAEGDRLIHLPEEERFQFFKRYGLERELAKIKEDLERFRVRFDQWFSETSLYEDGKVESALEALKEKGSTYESEGATWLAATKYGDDKDRVLVKQDGSYTYLLPDIAYHIDKFNRGFSRLINIWGADHHGYIPRLKAAMLSLGYEAERLEVLIAQMVNLYQDGEKVKMSKRTGKAVTMEELMDEVGVDAVRYFFTMRSMDSHLDFDMDLAVSKSNENPVYYVQYAHARICSLFRQADEAGVKRPTLDDAHPEVLEALNKEAEYDLLQKIAEWPEEVETAASQLAPHRLVRYVYELASLFHSYYRAERIIVEDAKEQQAKLLLISAIQIVIQNALRLIGVSAPERM